MPEFVITQGESSLDALIKIKEFFDCGNIFINRRYDNHTENLYRYCIRSHKDLNEKIIPFFTKYKLHTSKYSQFIRFVKIMNLIQKRSHLDLKGVKKIAQIASQMNIKKNRKFLESSETTR